MQVRTSLLVSIRKDSVGIGEVDALRHKGLRLERNLDLAASMQASIVVVVTGHFQRARPLVLLDKAVRGLGSIGSVTSVIVAEPLSRAQVAAFFISVSFDTLHLAVFHEGSDTLHVRFIAVDAESVLLQEFKVVMDVLVRAHDEAKVTDNSDFVVRILEVVDLRC